jgi:hypothetical protein
VTVCGAPLPTATVSDALSESSWRERVLVICMLTTSNA